MKHIIPLFLFLAWIGQPLMAEDAEKARVVTFKSNPVKCLAAIRVTTIDGRLRTVPAMGFDIEPGEHTLKGPATLDFRNCEPAQSRTRKQESIPPLNWYFEAGKVYYVGLDYSSPQRAEWRYVVWKVEYEDGEVVFDITEPDPDVPKS